MIDEVRLIWYIIEEYKKIINFFDNVTNQLPKFKTKNWV